MTEEDKQCRGLATLQAIAVSGFLEGVANIEASCLSVCNTCRDAVPVQRLRICRGVPLSILAMAYPSCQKPEDQILSRVFPHQTVINAGTRATDFDIGQAVDISNIQLPEGTSEIALCSCNRHINGVIWPIGLKILWFGQPTVPASMVYRLPDVFNTPLNGVTFPGDLREIFLGDSFNQPIEGIAWPGGLERLSLPGFNQSIRNVQWPSGLKTLEFVSPLKIRLWDEDREECFSGVYPGFRQYQQGIGFFNEPLGTALPPSLERLWLSSAFTQRLDSVVWPIGIVTLGLVFDWGSYLFGDSITWPPQLCDLLLVENG